MKCTVSAQFCFWLIGLTLCFSQSSLGITWNPGGTLPERQALLSPYFSPAIGQEVRLLSTQQQAITLDTLEKTQGEILVTPPPNTCFILQTARALPDQKICKSTAISFRFSDLTKAGEVQWTVFLDAHDSGTPISWKTPYAIGYAILERPTLEGKSASAKQVRTIAIDTCIGEQNSKNRSISFSLLGMEEKWKLSFPQKDKLLPQIRSNLSFHVQSDTALASVQKKEKTSSKPTKENVSSYGNGPSYEISDTPEDIGLYEELPPGTLFHQTYTTTGKSPSPVKKKQDQQDPRIPITWTLRPQDTFTMNGGHMHTQEFETIGIFSRCRYRYRHFPDKPTFGGVECYNIPGFTWILLPLSPACLAPILPR